MTGDSDSAIDRLTKAIVLASEAGRWTVVEALRTPLDRLTEDTRTAGVHGVRTIRTA